MNSRSALTPNGIEFTIPSSDNLAPRGFYMLWLITETGGVSDAKWVFLR